MEIVNIKCGEIYLTKNSSYYFHCIHCEEKFSSLAHFKNHNLNHFLVDINNFAPINDNTENLSNIKREICSDEEYENIEILDCDEKTDSFALEIDEVKSNISKFDNTFPTTIDIDFNFKNDCSEDDKRTRTHDIEHKEYSDNDDDDNNNSNNSDSYYHTKLNDEIIKIVVEDETNDSNSENIKCENVADATIIYCFHCEQSFSKKEEHNIERCELVQEKIRNFNGNLKFLREEGIFLCEVCPLYFGTNVKLQEHRKIHKKPVKSKNFLEHRISNLKKKINLRKLNVIDKDYLKTQDANSNNCENYSESDLEENKTKENSVKCSYCSIVLKSIEQYDEKLCQKVHLIKSKSENYFDILAEQDIFLCRECPRFYHEESKLNLHRRKHYNNGQCPLCSKTFKNLYVIEHMKSVHPEFELNKFHDSSKKDGTKKPFQCTHCNRKFVSKTYWKRHLMIHENKELQCKFCNKICKSPILLKNHLRTHTGEKPFICQLCPTAFSLKHNLDLHIIYKHTDERPFECRYEGGCGKSFKTDQLRNYHERRHTGVILGKCEICGTEYRNKSAFRKHMKLRHMSYNERPYQCEYCDKKFVEYGRLREHIRTHTGEKPLQCDICLKNFARYSVLREHKKLHTGIKSHVCSICGKAFAQTAGYFNHLKYHSKINEF